MNKEEFKKYVIEEAKKHLFSTEQRAEKAKPISESAHKTYVEQISSSDIKKLAEEIKKINKNIDLRNPMISESEEGIVDSIMNEAKILRERGLDVDSINKQKNIGYQSESEKDKWSRMMEYHKFNEESDKK